ncbi:MAG TPA: amidohydrolase family protein [Longimicrobium sp.]|nr:amidohydrolase family protein [Longimicrobium sp.]
MTSILHGTITLLATLLLAACASRPAWAPAPGAAPLAITNVTVVDVTGGPSRPGQTVLVEGGRIVGVRATDATRLPRGARAVDGTGRYLVPGMWDMHSHITMFGRTGLNLYLAHGVTGIRDMGGERFAVVKALRDSANAGQVLGPRIRIASPVVENQRWLAWTRQMSEQAGTPWRLHERFGPASAWDAERWVDSVVALGADHIKVRNWPDTAISRALMARARERGLQVAAHANEPFPRTGVSSYEHGIWPPLRVSDAARDSLWRHFAANGASVVPTLVTWPIRLDPPDTLLARLDDGRIAGLCYVPVNAVQEWREQLANLKQETGQIDWREVYRGEVRNAAEMHRAGVPLIAGTDVGAPLLVPGFSLHDELALLVRDAGMSPLQALQAATVTPARVMGLQGETGTVEAGMRADLVLLDADPLADIRNTRRIHAVVANGLLLDRAALNALLADARQGSPQTCAREAAPGG